MSYGPSLMSPSVWTRYASCVRTRREGLGLALERMARVADVRVVPEVERDEGEAEPIVLRDVRELVPPVVLAHRRDARHDVTERDPVVAAAREEEPRQAAPRSAQVVDDAVIAARQREGEKTEEVAGDVVRAAEIQGCSLALIVSAASSSASSSFATSVTAGSNH